MLATTAIALVSTAEEINSISTHCSYETLQIQPLASGCSRNDQMLLWIAITTVGSLFLPFATNARMTFPGENLGRHHSNQGCVRFWTARRILIDRVFVAGFWNVDGTSYGSRCSGDFDLTPVALEYKQNPKRDIHCLECKSTLYSLCVIQAKYCSHTPLSMIARRNRVWHDA